MPNTNNWEDQELNEAIKKLAKLVSVFSINHITPEMGQTATSFLLAKQELDRQNYLRKLETRVQEEYQRARHEAIAEVRLEIDKTPSYWRHPMALFPKYRTCQGDLKEMKTKDDILATLTKLQGDE